jgi:hypothetical protein
MPKIQATFDLVCLYAKSRDRKKIENLIDQERSSPKVAVNFHSSP